MTDLLTSEIDEVTGREFIKLVEIMRTLRSPQGCPWDREQTHESLRPYLMEETYEVLDSIDGGRYGELKTELGDLLLHIIFHSQLAAESGSFTIAEVLQGINDKLIRRHPHVFGDGQLENSTQVHQQWERLKLKEKERPQLLEGVPLHQPALNRAFRVQEKAAGVGFDWPDTAPVWEKIQEELRELRVEIDSGRKDRVEHELGDLLFSIVNLSRKLQVNPEDALRRSIASFTRRFNFIESRLAEMGKGLHDTDLAEMDGLWNEAKQHID